MAHSSARFFDTDDILAGETLIPVTLNQGVTGCGRALDPSGDDNDLHKGASIDIPLWLLPACCERNFVSARYRHACMHAS